MPIRKVITQDVVEVRDSRIALTTQHGPIFVNIGDRLVAAIPRVSDQSLSLAQKIAFDQATTLPSALNPIVLKNDLEQYMAVASVGGFKDSVTTKNDLPLTNNTVGDLRAVIDEGNIYRWADTLEWIEFIKIGTLSHSVLINKNGENDFKHITSLEKQNLINKKHTHSNKQVLDLISSLGSGKIITTSERNLLPSLLEKEALIGSAFLPEVLNRYVTSQDPRLNTLKNPYVTLGLLGTFATFQGEDISKLIEAFNSISGNAIVRALEMLPGYFQPNFDNDSRAIIWEDNASVEVKYQWDKENQVIVDAPLPYRRVENNALLFESMALRSTTLKFESFQPALQLIGPGQSQATVKGIVFEIRSLGTEGIKIERANTLIDECTFKTTPGALISHNLKGITVNASNCVIRRCIFEGDLAEALIINSENTRIEECQFNLSRTDSTALKLTENADFTISNNCAFYRGSVLVETGALSNLFTSCVHTDNSPFIDSGAATRWLSNRKGRYQQAYIGKTRTLGGPNSFADFCGSNETPFLQALADPYTKEIVVLADSQFIFNSTVTLPVGVKIRGCDTLNTSIVGPLGQPAFILNSHSSLENLSISATNAHVVFLNTNSQRVSLKNCTFNAVTTNFYGIFSDSTTTDIHIDSCTFTGSKGLILNSTRAFIAKNQFGTIQSPLTIEGSYNHVHANIFYSSAAANISGTNIIVDNNYFLATTPTKTSTVDSVWQGNWPHPEANNQDGHDYLRLSLNSCLAPIQATGVSFTMASGLRLLGFEKAGSGTVVTMPQKLTSKLNRALGFDLHLYWTSINVFSGSTLWEVTVTFRDRSGQDYGSSITKTVASPRTQRLFVKEELAIVSFSQAEYGYLLGIDISHFSVVIRRLADNPLDTMPGTAFLTEAQIILPRD